MEERLNNAKAAPAHRAMAALQTNVYDCGLEPLLLELVRCVPRRSMAAPTVSICTARMPALWARASSVSTSSMLGARHLSTPNANVSAVYQVAFDVHAADPL